MKEFWKYLVIVAIYSEKFLHALDLRTLLHLAKKNQDEEVNRKKLDDLIKSTKPKGVVFKLKSESLQCDFGLVQSNLFF